MTYNEFRDSNSYLDILYKSHKKHNTFSHLTNMAEDILKSIEFYYKKDDFSTLFDPLFYKLNDEIGLVSNGTYLSDRNGATIDYIQLKVLRTQNFFYCLAAENREDNYSKSWFKNDIQELVNFNLELKAEEILYDINNGINLDDYCALDDEDFESFKDYPYITINTGGETWTHYMKKEDFEEYIQNQMIDDSEE